MALVPRFVRAVDFDGADEPVILIKQRVDVIVRTILVTDPLADRKAGRDSELPVR
jgi:hypothetical protein